MAIRILGDITKEKVRILQEVDYIFISSLKKTGLTKLIERIAIEIYGEDANGEFKIKPSNLEIVSKYGKILNVQNESDYLIIELNMREKLMDSLCLNKVMEDINNA